jgi:hypothetical protein
MKKVKANAVKGMYSYSKNPVPKARQSSYSLNNGCAQGSKIDKLRGQAYAEKDSQRGMGSV